MQDILHDYSPTALELCEVEAVDIYNVRQLKNAKLQVQLNGGRTFISDIVNRGVVRKSVNGILSASVYTRYLTGFDIHEFGALLMHLEEPLTRAFRCSKMTPESCEDGGDEMRQTPIRLKVFLALMRLRKGYTTRELHALTGWSKSTIDRVCSKVELVLRKTLCETHYGLPTYAAQLQACRLHALARLGHNVSHSMICVLIVL